MEKLKIAVLGAGTWGMALARMLSLSGQDVTVWSALSKEVETYPVTRRHPNLPGMVIPEEIAFDGDIACCQRAQIVLFAVPSPFVRGTCEAAAPYLHEGQIVVDVAKGIEPGTLLTMTGILSQVLEKAGKALPVVALSGPTHAEEVARDMPTTIVSSSRSREAAVLVQHVMTTRCMRVYINSDPLGVELCGALKNIIALASGISTGLGFGDNAKAAIITRGMAEIRRLGLAMGASEATFSGLAGIGDLIVTATSMHSRNNRCGMLIGQGRKPEDAVREVGMVVEGINALPAAMELSRKLQVEMPICEAVNKVIGGEDPARIVQELMARDRKDEITGERTESALLGNL